VASFQIPDDNIQRMNVSPGRFSPVKEALCIGVASAYSICCRTEAEEGEEWDEDDVV
jgi:hypothetical protein